MPEPVKDRCILYRLSERARRCTHERVLAVHESRPNEGLPTPVRDRTAIITHIACAMLRGVMCGSSLEMVTNMMRRQVAEVAGVFMETRYSHVAQTVCSYYRAQ